MVVVFICDIFTATGKAVTEIMLDIFERAEEIVIGNEEED
jgi:hypothetical protein